MLQLLEYNMRPVEKKDLLLLLKWRNSKRVHSKMLTEHIITKEEHMDWFNDIVKTAAQPLHFVLELNQRRIGYIGYTDVDYVNSRCSPGMYLGEEDVPIDAGIAMGILSIAYIFDILHFNKASTIVLENNQRVYKLNSFLGYKEEGFLRGHYFKNGEFLSAYILGMLSNEWKENKKQLYELLEC